MKSVDKFKLSCNTLIVILIVIVILLNTLVTGRSKTGN